MSSSLRWLEADAANNYGLYRMNATPRRIAATMPEMSPAIALLFLREDELRLGYEQLFLAFRDLDAEADELLAGHGLGRGHGRAIHFIGRARQSTVSDLQATLGITLQSLGRLVRELTERDLVVQHRGTMDRRQRLLSLTEAGQALEKRIWECQRGRIARAYRESGPQSVDGFRRVLTALADRRQPRAEGE
jgi:DNA-binding MarR family transcriptional regulator